VTETLFPKFLASSWERVGETLSLEAREWDLESSSVHGTWAFVRDGETLARSEAIVRLYSYRELAGLLREAGFESVEGLEATTEEPLRLGADRALIRARVVG